MKHKEFIILTSVIFAGLSCGIICSSGCDFVLPGECKSEGYLFGPCRTGAESPNGCDFGLTCLEVPEGWICVDLDGEVSPEEQECSQWVGPIGCSDSLGLCWITCIENGDADCKGGTVCDDRHKMCVYPKAPTEPGETTTSTSGDGSTWGTMAWTTGAEQCREPGVAFGPCVDGACGAGLFCRSSWVGSVCLPSCTNGTCDSACSVAFGVACAADGTCMQPCTGVDNGCPAGQKCDADAGHCVWPQ